MSLDRPVSAIMTMKPVVANESTKFSQVLRLFTEFPVHHLPIVDSDNKLIGIISSNDLSKIFVSLCNNKVKVPMDFEAIDKTINLRDVMTPNPTTISSKDKIEKAAKIFAAGKFLSLPVVDKGVLVGILSLKDVIGFVAPRAF